MGFVGGIAGGCCVIITIAIVVSQCLIRRRKRKREEKAKLELQDMEGISNADQSENASKDTDGNITADIKKQKKTSKQKKREALEKKAKEGKLDPTIVVDYDDENGDGSFN